MQAADVAVAGMYCTQWVVLDGADSGCHSNHPTVHYNRLSVTECIHCDVTWRPDSVLSRHLFAFLCWTHLSSSSEDSCPAGACCVSCCCCCISHAAFYQHFVSLRSFALGPDRCAFIGRCCGDNRMFGALLIDACALHRLLPVLRRHKYVVCTADGFRAAVPIIRLSAERSALTWKYCNYWRMNATDLDAVHWRGTGWPTAACRYSQSTSHLPRLIYRFYCRLAAIKLWSQSGFIDALGACASHVQRRL